METYLYIILALFVFVLPFYLAFSKPEKKNESWICQKCQTKLVREEIKFGLCPNCGVKVKGFKGLTAWNRKKPFDYGLSF